MLSPSHLGEDSSLFHLIFKAPQRALEALGPPDDNAAYASHPPPLRIFVISILAIDKSDGWHGKLTLYYTIRAGLSTSFPSFPFFFQFGLPFSHPALKFVPQVLQGNTPCPQEDQRMKPEVHHLMHDLLASPPFDT